MPGIESETLNPVLIAQIASRLFNELPEAGSVPKYETDAAGAPSSLQESISDKTVLAGEPGRVNFPTDLQQQNFPLESGLPYVSETVPAQPEHDFYFLPGKPEKKADDKNKPVDVVFVVDGDHVKTVPVKIGISDDNFWEITDGLKEGDEVVTGGYHAISHDLDDGKKILKGLPDNGSSSPNAK